MRTVSSPRMIAHASAETLGLVGNLPVRSPRVMFMYVAISFPFGSEKGGQPTSNSKSRMPSPHQSHAWFTPDEGSNQSHSVAIRRNLSGRHVHTLVEQHLGRRVVGRAAASIRPVRHLWEEGRGAVVSACMQP